MCQLLIGVWQSRRQAPLKVGVSQRPLLSVMRHAETHAMQLKDGVTCTSFSQ